MTFFPITMRYLKISNKGEITPDEIELLGFSDKRGDSKTIGEKGTGLKFSRIQSLRKKIDFVVCTHEFKNILREKKGNNRLVFEYDFWGKKKKVVDSSYTKHAGMSDWVSDWFIVREVMQNARDENMRSDSTIEDPMGYTVFHSEIVKEIIKPPKGETFVFIELTKDIEEIFQNINNYFVPESNFFIKKSEEKMRVYLKGIYIDSLPMYSPFYANINLDELDLTESRGIKYNHQIWDNFWKKLGTRDNEEIKEFLRFCNKNPDNTESRQSWDNPEDSMNESLYRNFIEEFGTSVIIGENNSLQDYQIEKIKSSKKSYIPIGKRLFKYLKHKGVKDVSCLKNSALDYEIIKNDSDLISKIEKKKEKLDSFFGQCEIKFFEHKNDEILGFAENKKVFVNISILDSDILDSTLVEEYIHATTGYEDHTRNFQSFACKNIGKLLLGDSQIPF